MLDLPSSQGQAVDVPKRVKEYVDHLKTITSIFDAYAREVGLGVRLDPQGAIQAAKSSLARVMRFATGSMIPACCMTRN